MVVLAAPAALAVYLLLDLTALAANGVGLRFFAEVVTLAVGWADGEDDGRWRWRQAIIAFFLGNFFTHIGASVQLSSTDKCGNKLNC